MPPNDSQRHLLQTLVIGEAPIGWITMIPNHRVPARVYRKPGFALLKVRIESGLHMVGLHTSEQPSRRTKVLSAAGARTRTARFEGGRSNR